jgi:hypothetical protein
MMERTKRIDEYEGDKRATSEGQVMKIVIDRRSLLCGIAATATAAALPSVLNAPPVMDKTKLFERMIAGLPLEQVKVSLITLSNEVISAAESIGKFDAERSSYLFDVPQMTAEITAAPATCVLSVDGEELCRMNLSYQSMLGKGDMVHLHGVEVHLT